VVEVPSPDRILFVHGLPLLHCHVPARCRQDIGFAHYNQPRAVLCETASGDHVYYNFDSNPLDFYALSICHPHSSCLN
jgi:hypothetical protein